MRVLLGIDVGKTSLRVGVFSAKLTLLERWAGSSANVAGVQEAITGVQEAVAGVQEALRAHLVVLSQRFEIAGVGVSTFGPLEVDLGSQDFGSLIESSEPAWSGVNIPALVSSALQLPVRFDFDVNAGALAEAKLGAGRDVPGFVYLSVGTGIGGVVCRGVPQAGYAPQLGHMYVPREADDTFPGSCRFHGACLQGLASGKALAERWGVPAEVLQSEHPAWDLEARYLARACANLIYSFAPERIVLGSSVGSAPRLVERINRYLPAMLNGFCEPALRTRFSREAPVVQAALMPDSSLIGAAILAMDNGGLCFDRG